MAWFLAPIRFSLGLNTLTINNVMIPNTRITNSVRLTLLRSITMKMRTETTTSLAICSMARIREKVWGISPSVIRNTVGMSAPRYFS